MDGNARRYPAPRFTLVQIFERTLRRDTLVGSALASIANFGFWGVSAWVPALIQNRIAADPSLRGAGMSASSYVSFANHDSHARFAARVCAGRCAGGLVGTQGDVRGDSSRGHAVRANNLSGTVDVVPDAPASCRFSDLLHPWFIYADSPIYLPELFPTHLRTTGAGFCFNIGRVVSAAGPFLTGVVVLYTGSFEYAISALSGVYLLGPITLLFARDERTAATTRSG